MTADVPEPTDLFGDPWAPPKDRRGRPPHKRSPQMAEKVGVLRAMGRTEDEIVLAVGLSEKTLRKYYSRELREGPKLAKAILDERLWRRAMEGSVPAMRMLREALTRGEAAVPLALDAGAAAPAKAAKLGKKEQAQVDAHVAHEGTGWANLLQPEPKPN